MVDVCWLGVEPCVRVVNARKQQRMIAEAHARGETVEMAYNRIDDPPNSYRTFKLPPPVAVEL